jgi:excisionase family DNA binding protein
METVYTVKEVAELLKCSRDLVDNLIESNRLEAFDMSDPKGKRRSYRVSESALARYIATPTVKQEKANANKGYVLKYLLKDR